MNHRHSTTQDKLQGRLERRADTNTGEAEGDPDPDS